MSGTHTLLSPRAATTAGGGRRPSVVHRLPAEVKLVAAVAFVCVVAVTPRHAGWAFLVPLTAIGAVAGAARLPLRFVARRLAVVAPFLTTALLLPFVAGGERVSVAGLAVSQPGLVAATAIGAKTVIGALTSIVLAGTTPTPELVAALGRLHLPPTLVAIATFMVRYLDLLVDELERRRTAMVARAWRPRWLGHAGPVAATVGTMFVRSYERGERVHAAMVSRGYNGTMPVISPARARPAQWLAAAVLPLVALVSLAAPWLVTR